MPYLKTTFRVQLGRKVTNLKLQKIEDCTPRRKGKRASTDAARETAAGADSHCFMLIFRADDRLSNLQTIFPMEHDALGQFSLFLVETENEQGRFHYTATINHLHP